MKVVFVLIVLLANISFAADTASLSSVLSRDDARWWPIQSLPKSLLRVTNVNGSAAFNGNQAMTAQSVAGLAAKSVNEQRGDEMVWVPNGNVDQEDWLSRWLKRHPQVEVRGSADLWTAIEGYASKGIIKGYILYRADTSNGGLNEHRPGMNCSANVATSLAGILDGIIVDEALEAEAKKHGLKRLLDVRDKTQSWCFETYKTNFNRAMVCTQDPRKPHVRDFAIAQRAFTGYGYDAPMPAVMKWLEPLSPVLGWNGGDEFKSTEMSSRSGHIQTATDWCMNLPVLMAGTERVQQSRVKAFDPRTINWNDGRSAVSFVTTDGDNVQWLEGNFFRSVDGKNFWGNPARGKIPFGWSCCFAHLAQLCPEAIDYTTETQTANDSLIEWGGGYYFPDLFAASRTNRWQLLAQHARRTLALMKKSNTRIIGFNVNNIDSPEARKAYEVFARESEGLLAILVFQYSAYEAGAGKTFWVKDKNGVDVPVISARYSIWSQANRPRAGTPAKVAREIRETVGRATPEKLPRYDWVITHVWSYFKSAPGTKETAEEMPQDHAGARGGVRGYTPSVWCAERLPSNIRTVSPEEMAWRLRMKHNPEQTKKVIAEWNQ